MEKQEKLFEQTIIERNWQLSERTQEMFKTTKEDFAKKEVVDWKIYVAGLWWVEAF